METRPFVRPRRPECFCFAAFAFTLPFEIALEAQTASQSAAISSRLRPVVTLSDSSEHYRKYLMGQAPGRSPITTYTHLNKVGEHYRAALQKEFQPLSAAFARRTAEVVVAISKAEKGFSA